MQQPRELFYRWFVQYNPSYLLSAAFVFAGCFLWSRGVVHELDVTSTLEISLVAEVYAASLIGGAALLTRIGQRRPAVLLALIVALYQWDTTLHTEACAFLGSVGVFASLTWLAIFVAKLQALGWALRIRFNWRIWTAALIAALGFVIAPRVLRLLVPDDAGALLITWIFVLVSLYDGAGISSKVPLNAWGQTVLRRTTKAGWLLAGLLIGMHVLMWCYYAEVSLAPAILALPLFAIPRVSSEKLMWALVLGTLTLTFVVAPGALFVVAILAAAALILRVLDPKIVRRVERTNDDAREGAPYRTTEQVAHAAENKPISFERVELSAAERLRCWSGALFAIYLGVWTSSWSSGAFPHHLAMLDMALTLVVLVAVWRTRARAAFVVPLTMTFCHFVLQARLIPIPTSSTAWGGTAIGFGFLLLGASLAASYRFRNDKSGGFLA